ncbi:hypothetical protein GJAV_G00005850 [Gymnothorax javanicus]|nr:hypothetical protein GJAV_G00005850 [Gymnothorax javanicus]
MVDHEPEPCIITNGRLIGHRGLFNREVKSVDIERLVGDKMRTKRTVAAGGHDGGIEKFSAVALNSCLSLSPLSCVADVPPSNIPEEVLLQDEAERRQTDGSRGQSVSQRGRPQALKGDRDSPGSVAVDRPVEQHSDTEAREHGGLCKKQQPSKDCRTLKFCAQSCKPDRSLGESATATGIRSSEGMEDRLLSWADDCATVAARLCSALQLPLLCRRNLLGESKEALLLTLQKTHGSLLTDNLLKLEQQVTEFHSADLRKDNDSDTQSGSYKENMACWKQPRSSAGRTACSRRRRKRLFPQKVDVHLPEPQHTDTAFQWNRTYGSLHQLPPSLRSGSSNKISYPHTYFPERAISPQLPLRPPCLSPDVWSFPRMRLY